MTTTASTRGGKLAGPYEGLPQAVSAAPRQRIASIDIVRGLVMVLMAIDHVRVYSGQPAGGPTFGIFFTRWVTHFVAPAFVFLAGTAAYLHGRRMGSRGQLSRYLLARGAWLVLLELTVMRFAWTFNFDYAHYMLAGVIWMIGWCMILMAALVHLPVRAIAAFGIVLIAGHNLLGGLSPDAAAATGLGWLWTILYFGGGVQLGANGPPLIVLFSIVPWIGVMAAGYAFGRVMELPYERRRRLCLRLGLGLVVAFVVLRAVGIYGDPRPWRAFPPAFPKVLAFLATNKYPASLLFLLMTLGPTIALLPVAERARGRLARVLETFGRVPFFYYVLHIPLIHVLAILVSLVRDGRVSPWLFADHPMMNPPAPAGYMWSLPLLYGIFVLAVAILYIPCRWYAAVKARKRSVWLSYL
jgi:uncharacterized membrane protein